MPAPGLLVPGTIDPSHRPRVFNPDGTYSTLRTITIEDQGRVVLLPTIVNGRGSDISEGGLLIFAGVELKDGDEIFVEFTPPYSGEPIRVRSMVRNRSGYKYGVEFLWLNAEEHEQTAKFRSLLRLASSNSVV